MRRGVYAAGTDREADMKVLSIISAVAGAIFRLVAAIAVVYLIYRGAGICYDYGYRVFTEPAVSSGEGRTVAVTVTEGMSPLDVGELFESRGLVRDAKLFTIQYYLSEYLKDVGPGTFELNTAMTAEEMMAAMVIEKEEEGEPGEEGDTAPTGTTAPIVPAGGAESDESTEPDEPDELDEPAG